MTDTIKDISENITKTMTETCDKNNTAISHLNENVLELMKDKGMIAPYLTSSLVNLLDLKTTVNFKY